MNKVSLFTYSPELQRFTGQVWGVAKVEFLMQIRRWSVWVLFGGVALLAGLVCVLSFLNSAPELARESSEFIIISLTYQQIQFSTWLLALVAGLLVADRLPRDRALKMTDMYTSLLPHYRGYVLGKYGGNLLIICTGALLVILLDGLIQVAIGAPLQLLMHLVLAFCCVLIPVFLFVVAFVLLLSCVFSLKGTQIIFPIFWLYSSYTPLGYATLANTILAIDGHYALETFFGLNMAITGKSPYTAMEVWINILLVLGMATCCLLIASRLVFVQTKRRFWQRGRLALHKSKGARRTPSPSQWSMLRSAQSRLALWRYHLRVTHPFLLLLMGGSLALCSGVLLLLIKNGNLEHEREFACYILDLGVALFAGIITSATLTGDPSRELLVCSREGMRRIVYCRLGISLTLLSITATVFLFLSLALHISYTAHDSLSVLFSLWLIPLFLASTVGGLSALLTRNSALSSTITGSILLLQHFARVIIMQIPALQLFCLPLALFDPQTHLWWWNRLTLLCCAIVLLLLGIWKQQRDETLIETRI